VVPTSFGDDNLPWGAVDFIYLTGNIYNNIQSNYFTISFWFEYYNPELIRVDRIYPDGKYHRFVANLDEKYAISAITQNGKTKCEKITFTLECPPYWIDNNYISKESTVINGLPCTRYIGQTNCMKVWASVFTGFNNITSYTYCLDEKTKKPVQWTSPSTFIFTIQDYKFIERKFPNTIFTLDDLCG